MLDLDAGVHLQEVELVATFAPVHQELDRADVIVGDGLRGGEGGLTHGLAHRRVYGRGRTLLYELLVTALDRTVPLPEVYRVPFPVAHDLYLHVARGGQVLLDVNRTVPEIGHALPARPLERALRLGGVAGDGEALAATARRGLHGHGEAVLLAEEEGLLGGADGAFRAWHHRDPGLRHDPAASYLAPHRFYRLWMGPDPDEPGLFDRPRKRGALGQEAVPGVDGFGPAPPCDLDQSSYVQVALRRRRRAYVVGLVSDGHVQGLPVRIRVDSDARYSQLAQRANDTDRYLTAVGDQDPLEHSGRAFPPRVRPQGTIQLYPGLQRVPEKASEPPPAAFQGGRVLLLFIRERLERCHYGGGLLRVRPGGRSDEHKSELQSR